MSTAVKMILSGIIASDHGTTPPGAFQLLTTTTVVENSGSTQTDVPFEAWVPFSPTAFAATSAIGALDSDGTTVLQVQEDNRTSDLSVIRGLKVTGILPSITANEKRQISIGYYTSTSPTTGTDVTTADILATAYDCAASAPSIDGNTYTASARTGLAAGAWTNTSTASYDGTWRTGGGIVTEHIVKVPLKNGGTPHPSNAQFVCCISAYKLNRAAVSGGNAIICIETRWWIEGGFVQQTSPVDFMSDLTVTSGTNTQSWVGSSPALTLTLSSNTVQTIVTASVPSGTPFSLNSIGTAIGDGTGYGVIVGYTNGNSVSLMVFKAFASTTRTSGNWRIYGVNIPNGAAFPMQTIWYSGLAQPNVTTYLGAAYNSGTLTGGPGAYILSTKVTRNYDTAAASVTNSTGNLDACGTNPTGYVSTSIGTGLAGDIAMFMGQAGGRPDIGDVPGFYVGALLKWDANAPAVVFGNAGKAALVPAKFRDTTTGKTMLLNNGTDYYIYSPPGTATLIPSPANGINNWTPELNHWGHFFYLPYLLSGDFFYAEMLQATGFCMWAFNDNGYTGSQLNRIAPLSGGNQCRGVTWTLQKVVEAAAMTPDRSPSCLGWSQSHARTWLTNMCTTTNSGVVGVAPFPGLDISYTTNVGGSGKTYATSGPRWVGANGGNGQIIAMYMLGYLGNSCFKTKRMGMADSYMLGFIDFVVEGLIYNATNTTEINPTFMVPSYWCDQVYNSTVLKTGADIYAATASDPFYAAGRQVNSAVTLSGTSGTITVTFPAGTVSNGGTAFYADGPIRQASGPGVGKIISISGDTVTMTTTGSIPAHDGNVLNCAAFSSTTLAANDYYLPWPAPGDSVGSTWQPPPYSSYFEYWDIAQSVAVQYAADGYTNGAAALSFINGAYSGGNELKWKCAP